MYRVIVSQLGVPIDSIRLIQGDSDEVPEGTPPVAARSLMMAGNAVVVASQQVIEKGYNAVARLFEVSRDDLEFADGAYRISGTDVRIQILDLADRMKADSKLSNSESLDTVANFNSPQLTFPSGCHICEVEIDPDTGVVEVVNCAAVDDVGNIINEEIVEGQVHGGVVQGLGQVLGEQVIYSETGELLTASLMDYFIPRASDMPTIHTAFHAVPCTTNPLGVKGAGESGVVGALPCAMSAIRDALSARGVFQFDMPATPSRVWDALQAVSASSSRE